MSADVPASHAIFMVVALIAATAVGASMIGIAFGLADDLQNNSERLSEVMRTDIKIINDPDEIPYSGGILYIYVLNCGQSTLLDDWMVIVDGNLIPTANIVATNQNNPGSSYAPYDVTILAVAVSMAGIDHSMKVMYGDLAQDRITFRL